MYDPLPKREGRQIQSQRLVIGSSLEVLLQSSTGGSGHVPAWPEKGNLRSEIEIEKRLIYTMNARTPEYGPSQLCPILVRYAL
jgi:hypothetical protein